MQPRRQEKEKNDKERISSDRSVYKDAEKT